MDEAGKLAYVALGKTVTHPEHGRGRVAEITESHYVVVFERGAVEKYSFDTEELSPGASVAERSTPTTPVASATRPSGSANQWEALRELLEDLGAINPSAEMGKRWVGGKMVLEPGKPGTQSKEIPLDAFFKKIIGVRERLRVLEQKINNHPVLTAEDKIELEGYITRCYGSLTTFNVLFGDKEDQFRGTGKED